MSIAAIPPINPFGALGGAVSSTGASGASGASSTGGSFADSFANALDTLQDSHTRVDQLAIEAATGDLSAVHDFTIAASEAQMLTQLTVEVRNKAVEAFNDIMRMQV